MTGAGETCAYNTFEKTRCYSALSFLANHPVRGAFIAKLLITKLIMRYILYLIMDSNYFKGLTTVKYQVQIAELIHWCAASKISAL